MNHPHSPKRTFGDTYTTYITFTSGDTHKEDPIGADKVASTITRLVRGPAAQMGMIKEVKIVDSWDCIVFLARDNKILHPAFPPENNSQK